MHNADLAKKIAGDLAGKYGVPVEAIAHAMRAGYDLALDDVVHRDGRGALANTRNPQVACAVLAAVPGIVLCVTHRGLEIRADRPIGDQKASELQQQVTMAMRAAEAMLPEPPPVCDSCRKDPPCSKCGHLPRRY